MIRYDVPEGRQMMLSNVQTDSQLNLMSRFVSLSCELGIIMTRYDLLESNE